ncbi:MAG: hypothetical protein IPQ16_02870 [Geobacteraceae bacterium]|nr:hypothetical protein [Geobacteraceae bacterium]
MSQTTIDIKQALQIARPFNLAFNNAFMYGGSHQTTKDSAAAFYRLLQPFLTSASNITVSVDRGSVFIESHCVDKVVSVPRIISRFTKTGVQSITFDRDATQESVQALYYVMGALSEFQNVDQMQTYLRDARISGARINYVVYQKVTLDDTVVDKITFSETQLLLNSQKETYVQADPEKILKEFSEILSLQNSTPGNVVSAETGASDTSGASRIDYGAFISSQIKSLNNQLAAAEESTDATAPTPAEMLENIYKLKENVLENIRIQRETGKLTATDELAINEINQISYQVIVRLIKEEYRNDRTISVKRLAQIIRRMLPDIKELKYLLPQLKDGLFAEGMSPADYLSLVKELNKELDSDGLIQILIEASDQVGLTFKELLDGIKDAPEEAARIIVLAAELKKGGVKADDEQMSTVLSDYIEKVSRALALESPEAATSSGGRMLKSAVTRIEREILDRLKAQNIASNTVSEVAEKLASQFSETVSMLHGDWIRTNLTRLEKPTDDMLLSIIEQVAERGQGGGVTEEIQAVLISHGFSAETIDTIVKKAQQRAAEAITHEIELPEGVMNAREMLFFLDREIKRNLRYNAPFSTILITYEQIVDLRTFTTMDLTRDMHIQLTNQSLLFLNDMRKMELDLLGIITIDDSKVPFLILPMADSSGVLFVKRRIDKEFPCHEFLVDDITVHIVPKVMVSSFSKKRTPDMDSYVEALHQLYTQPKQQ